MYKRVNPAFKEVIFLYLQKPNTKPNQQKNPKNQKIKPTK